MSHTTEINEVVFGDVEALKQSIKALQKQGVKCELKENEVPRAYFANQQGMGKAPIVLKLTDAQYDVGFYHDKAKGGLIARTDFYGGSVQRVLGAQITKKGETQGQAAMGKLFQMYAVTAAKRKAVQQGYSVREQKGTDGSIKLVLTGIKG
jgi:Protein of unknown function (DUF1257)